MAFPVGTTVLLTLVLAVALLFDGISTIIHGIGDKESQGWTKTLSIGVGGVEVALSGLILVSPAFGAATIGFLIGIALLLACNTNCNSRNIRKKETNESIGYEK